MVLNMSIGAGGLAPAGYSLPARGAAPAPAAGPASPAAGPARQAAAGAALPVGTPPGERIAYEKAEANVMNARLSAECQTCKNRKYQDGSNDAGVSFKTPTHVDPGASFAAVASHEQEHVTRNKAKAEAEGGEVVSSTVIYHGATCPECGRYYIAGGTTYTTTRHGGHNNEQDMANKAMFGGLDMEA